MGIYMKTFGLALVAVLLLSSLSVMTIDAGDGDLIWSDNLIGHEFKIIPSEGNHSIQDDVAILSYYNSDITNLKHYTSNGHLLADVNQSIGYTFVGSSDNEMNLILGSFIPKDNRVHLLKYFPNGQLMWDNNFSYNPLPSRVIIDDYNNIIMTGYYFSGPGPLFISKLSPFGLVLWEDFIQAYGHIHTLMEKSNNLIVIYDYYDTAVWGIKVRKYSTIGTIIWEKDYRGNVQLPTTCYSLIDNSGNILIPLFDFSGNEGFRILKYSDDGELLFDLYYKGEFPEHITALKVDKNNNIILGCDIDHVLRSPEIFKYSLNGTLLWKADINSSGFYVRNILTDNNGDIIIGVDDTGYDGEVFKYSSNGSFMWSKETVNNCYLLGVDSYGNIIVPSDKSLTKMSPYGSVIWETPYHFNEINAIPKSMHLDSYNNIVLTVQYENSYGYGLHIMKYEGFPPMPENKNLPINSIMGIINSNLEEED